MKLLLVLETKFESDGNIDVPRIHTIFYFSKDKILITFIDKQLLSEDEKHAAGGRLFRKGIILFRGI